LTGERGWTAITVFAQAGWAAKFAAVKSAARHCFIAQVIQNNRQLRYWPFVQWKGLLPVGLNELDEGPMAPGNRLR
jgi:hypothetical protein